MCSDPICSSFRTISEDLEKKGALHSLGFLSRCPISEKETKLKAGSFLIPINASMQDISNIVTKGDNTVEQKLSIQWA